MAGKFIHVSLNEKKDKDIIQYLNDKSTTDIVKCLVRFAIENNLQFKTIATYEK
jgi:hypothetical protein